MSDTENLVPEMPAEESVSEKVPPIGRFLFGSRQRISIFRDVQKGVSYAELTDRYGDSLTSDTINSFREKSLVVKTSDNRVRLTPLGEYISANYANLIQDLRQVKQVDEFFAAIPAYASDLLNPDVIKGGETLSGNLVDKNAVVYDYVNNIRQADEIKEIVPRLIRAGLYDTEGNSIYRQRIMEDGLQCTFIHTEDVAEAIASAEQQRAEAQEHQQTQRVSYWRYSGEFPFTLTIYDDELITLLADNSDGVKVLFQNDTEASLEWANDIFETYKAKSKQFSY
ncbi:transcriptional regulator FilR1 domain-containing protein [Halobellus inordinatus]|uniref:transcriptional regulator FilR1 domain-containing protein n=1 Tax=Halobellus inordinatus TaxID=1126236 RepID=UPI002113C300|nr:hypothetical protein [Halobellus ramosii]